MSYIITKYFVHLRLICAYIKFNITIVYSNAKYLSVHLVLTQIIYYSDIEIELSIPAVLH